MKLPALLLAWCLCGLAQAGGADGDAAYRLGLSYRNGIGVAADSAKAVQWLELAARRQVPAAMFILSNMLAAGEGVAADRKAARTWLEAAAELEYPEALQALALSEPDPARAAQLMKEAEHALRHRGRATWPAAPTQTD